MPPVGTRSLVGLLNEVHKAEPSRSIVASPDDLLLGQPWDEPRPHSFPFFFFLLDTMKSFLTALTFVTAALAASRTSAPSGCLTVKKSGGQYSTIQKAVDALSTTDSAKQCIFIDQGTYSEQVLVPARTAQLTIYGYTADTSSYAGNKVTITAKKSQADGLDNDGSATLRIKAKNFKLYNVNVANTYGKGSQAVALSAYSDSAFYASAFTGFQDTLLAQQGNQLYSKCLIQGATDFIFGQKAMAWFEKCDLRVVAASLGYVTANGRASSSDKSEYVFNSCSIAAASGNTVADGAYYLGRPWGQYAQVVFQKTSMTGVINSAGWKQWNDGDPRTANVLFGEYQNTGIGSQGTRASFSKKLSAAVTPASILGSSYTSAAYYDSAYM
ncbi:pectinesterase [Colletotrichum scovillei]|uniref:Pectinesterase n=7 Tax=Colletotrichum acutatum species complex TaxID=2707335 RepID=A0A9P7RCF7_9PEZI|nr:pectinesterase [Colletotrichum scovillei]KAG7074256.1 pectinesterase [Colletotrichum scovillei]KAG7081081.1 pectinesterase [Colletotrichum scovillei]